MRFFVDLEVSPESKEEVLRVAMSDQANGLSNAWTLRCLHSDDAEVADTARSAIAALLYWRQRKLGSRS